MNQITPPLRDFETVIERIAAQALREAHAAACAARRAIGQLLRRGRRVLR